jgi:hypothetical protein
VAISLMHHIRGSGIGPVTTGLPPLTARRRSTQDPYGSTSSARRFRTSPQRPRLWLWPPCRLRLDGDSHATDRNRVCYENSSHDAPPKHSLHPTYRRATDFLNPSDFVRRQAQCSARSLDVARRLPASLIRRQFATHRHLEPGTGWPTPLAARAGSCIRSRVEVNIVGTVLSNVDRRPAPLPGPAP